MRMGDCKLEVLAVVMQLAVPMGPLRMVPYEIHLPVGVRLYPHPRVSW
jgi:hypothetical protein